MPLTFSVYPGLPGRYVPFTGFHLPIGMAELLKTRGYRTAWFSAADPEWEGMGEMAKRAGMDEVVGPDELHGPAISSWGTEDGVMIGPALSLLWAGEHLDNLWQLGADLIEPAKGS